MTQKGAVEPEVVIEEPVELAPPQRVVLDSSSPSIRSIARVVVITLVILFIAGSVESLISSIAKLFFLVILAIFFAYLLSPLVKLIRLPFKTRKIERLMPRSLAIMIAYLIVFAVLGVVISNLAPRVIEQAKEFGTNVPTYAATMREKVGDLTQRFDRLRIPDEVQTKINEKAASLGEDITTALGSSLLNVVTYIPWLLLIPILAFFFLKDVNLVRLAVLRTFPAGPLRYRAEMVMQDVNTTLAAYTRAQLISCFLIGLICIVGFWALGLKYALLLGIIAGAFEFVPLIGPAAVGIIVIATAAASDNPWKALYVAIFLIVLRIVQDYVLYPRIVREGIHLHPLIIILSVLAGEQVAGIPGVFISIPIVAILTVLYRHFLEHHGRRGLFAYVDEETSTAPTVN